MSSDVRGHTPEAVIALATQASVRIATVETVTGGHLAATLTDVPGASAVFERGYVLYHSDAKSTGLGADPAIAARYGAVSAEVTASLVDSLDTHSTADIGIAMTGYAGPTGGNAHDPVGTVYLATYERGRSHSVTRYIFKGDRAQVKSAAVEHSLTVLADLIADRL